MQQSCCKFHLGLFHSNFKESFAIEIINNKARHNLINVQLINTVRWRSDWLDGAVFGSFLGTPWSNESDALPPEGDNPLNLLFSSRMLIHP